MKNEAKLYTIIFSHFVVTRVRFAHDDKSRMACSSLDGQLSICQVIPSPATVIASLQGHKAGVTGELCTNLKYLSICNLFFIC